MQPKKKVAPKLDLVGSSVDAIIHKLNKKYGENTLITAAQADGLKVECISTGIFDLDFALMGGWAKNRIHELRGGYSSLKSTATIAAMRNFLKLHPDGLAFYDDAEHSFDPSYLRLLGVTDKQLRDNVLVSNPDSGEQAVDVLNDVLSINDRELFCIVDSVAALVPMAEQESSVEQQLPGLQARLVNKAMRISNARIKRSLYDNKAASATVIFINQLREKIGVMFGNPETTPGGKGKDFFYSSIIRFASTASNAIKQEVERNGVKRVLRFGQIVRFSVLKCKFGGSQFEEGEFEYYVRPHNGYDAYSFNNIDAVFNHGVFHGVIEYDGSFYRYGNLSYRKQLMFVLKLRERPSMVREIYEGIVERLANVGDGVDAEAEQKFDEADEAAEVAEVAEEVVSNGRGKISFSK